MAVEYQGPCIQVTTASGDILIFMPSSRTMMRSNVETSMPSGRLSACRGTVVFLFRGESHAQNFRRDEGGMPHANAAGDFVGPVTATLLGVLDVQGVPQAVGRHGSDFVRHFHSLRIPCHGLHSLDQFGPGAGPAMPAVLSDELTARRVPGDLDVVDGGGDQFAFLFGHVQSHAVLASATAGRSAISARRASMPSVP